MKQIKRYFRRLVTAYTVLKYPHCICICLTTEELTNNLKGKDIETHMRFHGLQQYNCHSIIRQVDNAISDEDLVLMKADFMAMAEEYAAPKP